jgi:Transposase
MPKQRKSTMPAVHTKPIQRKHAAGIDIGATSIYVAVPVDRDPQPVRSFQTFTEDLQRLADWLQHCRIKTVAMESTGVFWVPLFQILEQRGFEVCLVSAHHVKNVPGRKTDVSDCQWLQYLHSVGLLQASFGQHSRSARFAPCCGIVTAWCRQQAPMRNVFRRRWTR